jgi:hypothetical protein
VVVRRARACDYCYSARSTHTAAAVMKARQGSRLPQLVGGWQLPGMRTHDDEDDKDSPAGTEESRERTVGHDNNGQTGAGGVCDGADAVGRLCLLLRTAAAAASTGPWWTSDQIDTVRQRPPASLV